MNLSPLNSNNLMKQTSERHLALIFYSDFRKNSDLIKHQRKHCITSVKTEIEQRYSFSKDNGGGKSKCINRLYIKIPTNIWFSLQQPSLHWAPVSTASNYPCTATFLPYSASLTKLMASPRGILDWKNEQFFPLLLKVYITRGIKHATIHNLLKGCSLPDLSFSV